MNIPITTHEPKVTLVCMPWTALLEPSLGLGILKSKLLEESIACKVFYGHIRLLKYMRSYTYEVLSVNVALNDWMFTATFEEEIDEMQEQTLDAFIRSMLDRKVFQSYSNIKTYEDIRRLLFKIRNTTIPRYLNDCMEAILADEPTMVGFTCLFDQTFASLALAKMIKKKRPDILIAMGGYALEGPLSRQIIDSFDFVDCVVTGEGEPSIIKLAQASVGLCNLEDVPGAHYRRNNETIKSLLPQPFINLNQSPFPDYDDFTEQIQQLKTDYNIDIKWQTIPVEASRGCWWGQKSHCTFCGIDDHTMTYRQKKTETVLSMLDMLNKKYKRAFFRFSDYILPNNYYNELLPLLAREQHKLALSCEIKANITEEKARLLHNAGFIAVQPGIESFSTAVLRIMKKGVTAMQNIYTVMLGTRYSLKINYNLLYGFPDDTEEAYATLLKTIPRLYHIQPPENETKIAITRFAPLEQMYSKQNMLRHHDVYDLIFSRRLRDGLGFDFFNYCYQFNVPYTHSEKLEEYYSLLSYQVNHWKDNFHAREVVLIYEDLQHSIRFADTRYDEHGHVFVLDKICRDIFMKCEMKIASLKVIREEMCGHCTENEFNLALHELDERRVVFIEDEKILGLAFLLEDYRNYKIDKHFMDSQPLESQYIDYALRQQINLKYELAVSG